MNAIQDEYEQVSYPHYVHPLTDPARLAALGRILGFQVAQPAAARVLDIGCGSGSNLLAMAERLSNSRFRGIDFAATEIAAGRELAAEAGLQNVEFEQADLLTWESHGTRYDYIIAYGLFSWVPDEVKDRLFQVCRECLAPQGIACISYMTYPGCKQPEALRDLLRLRTVNCGSSEEKVAAAHNVLDFLDRTYERLPMQAHSGHLREEVRKIRRKELHSLLLDDLGVERDPCYLLQFANWAAEHGLRYVGESEFHTMFFENLPPDSARELADMGLDRLETEQMIDYVVNRSFRCSLLVGAEAGETLGLDATALIELCFKPQLRPDGKPDVDRNQGCFLTSSGFRVTLRSEPLVAFARALTARPGAFTPFAEILSDAQAAAGHAFTIAEESRLCQDLLSLYARRQVDLSTLAFAPPEILPQRPRLTLLNLAAARRHSMVMTAFHEASRLSPAEQALCALLDGTRNEAELRSSSEGGALGRDLEPLLDGLRRAGCFAQFERLETSDALGTLDAEWRDRTAIE